MGRPCGSESFLPQKGRKDACVTGILVTEKAYEVSFLEAAQHIPHPCFVFHFLARHGAVFTEETIEVFVLLLHGHGKEGIAIEGKGRSFHFPVAAVGSSQDAAFPLFLQGIQFFFSPDGDIVPDIVFMEKGEAEHGYPQGAKAERCIFGNLLCFLPVFRNAGTENIIHSQFLPLRRNKGPEEMTQPPSHGFGAGGRETAGRPAHDFQ